jgi:hypothetical protein
MKRSWLRSLAFLGAVMIFGPAQAEMVPSSSISNDPAKERLCASRAQSTIPGKTVPFEIDSRYVATARSQHPDATFVAIDGLSPQLVECYLREGTGRYEPASFSPEQSFWHTIKPAGVGIDSPRARSIAAKTCLEAALSRSGQSGLDHSVNTAVFEVDINRAGTIIAGTKAERYDVAVEGTSFYKSAGPDLRAVKFTCLLTRALQVKAVQLK